MALIDVSGVDRFEATSNSDLERMGLHLTMGHDFEEFKELSSLARPDHTIGEPFCPSKQDLGKGNALWLAGHDASGTLVHLQALRLVQMGDASLAEHLRRNFSLYMPTDMDIDFKRSRYRPGPGAKRMAGNIVYSGEMWIGGEKGQFRGTSLSSLLGRKMFLTALREFGADYVFGFMAQQVAHKGFSVRMGYIHIEPHAVRLKFREKDDIFEGLMAYMSADDIEFVLGMPSAEIEALAA